MIVGVSPALVVSPGLAAMLEALAEVERRGAVEYDFDHHVPAPIRMLREQPGYH